MQQRNITTTNKTTMNDDDDDDDGKSSKQFIKDLKSLYVQTLLESNQDRAILCDEIRITKKKNKKAHTANHNVIEQRTHSDVSLQNIKSNTMHLRIG